MIVDNFGVAGFRLINFNYNLDSYHKVFNYLSLKAAASFWALWIELTFESEYKSLISQLCPLFFALLWTKILNGGQETRFKSTEICLKQEKN